MQNNMTLAECMGLIESKTGYKVYSRPKGYQSGFRWGVSLSDLFRGVFGVLPPEYDGTKKHCASEWCGCERYITEAGKCAYCGELNPKTLSL